MGTIYRNANYPEHSSILAQLVAEAIAELETPTDEELEAAETEAQEADREAADALGAPRPVR